MKKFIVEESEVKRILSMHKVIKEQAAPAAPETPAAPKVDPLLQKLRDAVSAGCLSNGKIYFNKTKNLYYYRGVKQSTKQEIDFFPDMTYNFVDGTKKGKWTCSKLATAAADAKTAQETQSASKSNVEKVKKEGEWKTKEELLKNDTEQNIENPVMYEKKDFNGTILYRRKVSSGIGGALTDDQQKIVDKWTSQGAKLRKDLDPEQAKTWVSRVVSPASEGYFSQDLIMYFDPEVTVKDATITTTIQQSLQNRIPTDQKDCKKTIEVYYLAFKKKRPLEPNEFEALKAKTQSCKNEYGGDWGMLSGGRRMDNYLEIMSGGIGGPSRRGEDAKWRLN
jgi:hypothetical protein